MNWKDLKTNPPTESCVMAVRFDDPDGNAADYALYEYDADIRLVRNYTRPGAAWFAPHYDFGIYYITLNDVKK